jgi:hypothetical protein
MGEDIFHRADVQQHVHGNLGLKADGGQPEGLALRFVEDRKGSLLVMAKSAAGELDLVHDQVSPPIVRSCCRRDLL